jgi:hypothetical protein
MVIQVDNMAANCIEVGFNRIYCPFFPSLLVCALPAVLKCVE